MAKLDIFDRISRDAGGPIGQYQEQGFGYYMFPRLEGELGPHMVFNGVECLNWSLNNYLGLANHPEVRKADASAAKEWGLAYPMGSRMLTGHTRWHEELERRLAAFEKKEDAFLFNFGYQGIVSSIDSLLARHDVVVYDAECHACLLDGIRLHVGEKYKYRHNDIAHCEQIIARACAKAEEQGGGVMLITEGVYGMTGALGILDKIVALKKKYNFRIMIDDAHGFGVMGEHGRGTSEHFGVMDEIDLYIGAFAKSMASIGGFIAGPRPIINYLRFNMRSQMYAKALPMPLVMGNLKRLEIIDSPEGDELRKRLFTVTRALQDGFRNEGFDIGEAEACVTPVMVKGGMSEATNVVKDLRENYKIFCSMVIYPVIPKGMIIFRIIPTAVHTLDDVQRTLDAFKEIRRKLQDGYYSDEIAPMTVK